MDVVTVKEMRDLEKNYMEKKQVDAHVLMKRAGYYLVKDLIRRVNPTFDAKMLIIAGVGHNGGDALVMASELQTLGYRPTIFVIGSMEKASKAFLHYFDLVGHVEVLSNAQQINQHQATIFEADIIIDGLFGIGLSKPVTGFRKELIDLINVAENIVYSIDIPSGIHPDTGCIMGKAVHASYTGIVGAYKIGNLVNDALDTHGKTSCLDIGILDDFTSHKRLLDLDDYSLEKDHRKHQSHKYTYGFGQFIGGRQGMMGSIQMSAMAALRSGLGIVKVITNVDHPFTQFYPEVMFGSLDDKAFLPSLQKTSVVVYGPGIEDSQTNKDILNQLLKTDIPLVIDASGLDHIVLEKQKHKAILLTPHLGELARLVNAPIDRVKEAPLKYLKELTNLGFKVLLKGPCNIYANQERITFIQVKETGLATAGTGDVLAGIIAGRIKKEAIDSSVIEAIYIQHIAAQAASQRLGPVSLTATDLINDIHRAFKEETNEV